MPKVKFLVTQNKIQNSIKRKNKKFHIYQNENIERLKFALKHI
jgi:hypothetical protein